MSHAAIGTVEIVQKLLSDWDNKDIRLSAWEIEFLEEMESRSSFTQNQIKKIDEIYVDKY